ncbi:MAG: hypothetical protein JRJ43_02250 [Deltaproteobacteria bacterium]|nr:hypothetical protein [Deltaproteobacteria bacterium]MBW1964853.1 hypothetical protein [Deltaproteobacteria bacterium]
MNIERPTSNVEWEKMNQQTYDLEKKLLIIAEGWISVYFSLRPSTFNLLDIRFSFDVGRSMFDVRRSSFNMDSEPVNAH